MAGAVGTAGAEGLLGSVDERGSKTDAVGLRICYSVCLASYLFPENQPFFL